MWFGNNLICDPNYTPGVQRCMGTQNEYDYGGFYYYGTGYYADSPTCGSSTNPTSPSTGSSVTKSLTFGPFVNATIIRVQYKVANAKGGWKSISITGSQVGTNIAGLLPNTLYEYRLGVFSTPTTFMTASA